MSGQGLPPSPKIEAALAALAPYRELRGAYSRRAAAMRAAFTAGANISAIARAAGCERSEVYRAIRNRGESE